ncbi:MarR family transcriptional regulator [Jatrophihabitans sp. GAS493]|uniref:MarR family winged helix-turn-helix transcriptional regulator n=1 Tax=Jatrophihabitans sp. GAS493 TaxID=1907575 RepID=UPI000BB7064C|nr:MarR family transcriptional regulator [Jatrophihabitans sp. GAS493]SOD73141.1 MarR family transcriptional regulator [Jatrophihabitans sp. GAS493]
MAKAAPTTSPTAVVADEVDEFVSAVLTASRVLVGVSARSLNEVEGTVTLTQFRTLVVLDSHGELNLNGLAEILDVNSSTAMRMIDKLLSAGLVTRSDDPENRRRVILALTPAGRALVRRVTTKRRKEITRIVSRMAPDHRAGLVTALLGFAAAASEPDADPDAAMTFGW